MTLEIAPKTTALVLIDLQFGILGMALAPHDKATVVANSAKLGKALADRGGTICLVHVGLSEDGKDRLSPPVDAPSPPPPPGGMPKDWSDFVPQIAGLQMDIVIKKRQWGAFHGTELDLQLRRRGITSIILAGVLTNMGVETTAREAWQHNYAIVLAEDACSGSTNEMHQFSVTKILPRISRVRSTEEIMAALGAAR